jgi:ankyrin repeat protein
MSNNLAIQASRGALTVEDVAQASKTKLEQDKYPNGFSVLYQACSRCSVDVVQAILDKGIDINETSGSRNWTPLSAAVSGCQWNTVRILLRLGAKANFCDFLVRNELHYAAQNGAPEDVVKQLIDAGVDPQAKQFAGLTPADIARLHHHPSLATYLDQFCLPQVKSANFIA